MTELNIAHVGGKQTMVVVYDGLVSEVLCEQLLSVLRVDYPKGSFDGLLSAGYDPHMKVSKDLHFSAPKYQERELAFSMAHSELENQVHQAFSSCIAHYLSVYELQTRMFDQVNDTGFQVQRYDRNYGYFRQHVDSFPSQGNGNRVLSIILYLNTVEQGGETTFPLHELAVHAVAGRVVIFPAVFTHPHEGRPPLSSEKWIINTFITNTVTKQVENLGQIQPVEEQTEPLDKIDAPHTHFDDAFMHPHDESNHTHDAPAPKRKSREPKK